jgi:hypothetical protein
LDYTTNDSSSARHGQHPHPQLKFFVTGSSNAAGVLAMKESTATINVKGEWR